MENSLNAPMLFAIDAAVRCIESIPSDLPVDSRLPRIPKRWGQGVCHRLTGADTAPAGSVVVMDEFKETEINGSTAA
jgi:hypothetical protein